MQMGRESDMDAQLWLLYEGLLIPFPLLVSPLFILSIVLGLSISVTKCRAF